MNLIWTNYISHLAVIPVLLAPLQVLIVALPALFIALFSIITAIAKPRKALKLLKLMWHQKVSIVVLVMVIFAGRYAWNEMQAARKEVWQSIAPKVDKIDWPMFKGSLSRTGVVPGELGPLEAGVNWIWKQKKEAYLSSPAVVGDRVYITSAEMGLISGRGYIYCFDRETGSLIWKDAPARYQPTLSSPSVSGNYLVCGEGMHQSRNSRVVAMDISDERDVRVAWTFRTASHVECTPVIHEGRVYVGAGDDGYYCLELEPGRDGNPVVVWHLEGADYPDAETALAVYGNRVYAGLGVGGEALCVLDAETGEEIKRIPASYPVFTPPSIHNGRLYIGLGGGNYIYSSAEVRDMELNKLRSDGASEDELQQAAEHLADGGEVWCVDLETLGKLWVYKCRSTVLSAICAVDEGICFVTRDGQVNLLDHNGKLIASRDLSAITLSPPTVTTEYIYQMTGDGYLYAMDRKTLDPKWNVRVGSGSLCLSAPAVSDGRLYLGTEKDGFICLGSREVEEKVQSWIGHLGGAGKSGNPKGESFSELGNFLWQYPQDQEGEKATRFVVAPPASVQDRIYVPLAEDRAGLACLAVAEPGHTTPDALWLYQTDNGVVRSPAATPESVFITDTGDQEKQGNLHHIATSDGSLIWKKELKQGASGFIALQNDYVLVQDGIETLTAYSFEGERLWSEDHGRLAFPLTSWNTMALLSVDEGKSLVLIDAPTGKQLWKIEMLVPSRTAPVVHKGEVVTGTERGLEYRSMLDGSIISTVEVKSGGCKGTLTIKSDRIFCASGNGEELLEFYNRSLTRVYEDLKNNVNPIISSDGSILYLTYKGLMAIEQAGEDVKPVLWADVSWLGTPTSPMILHNKSIYMGMSGWGMVCIGGEK